jgi:glutamate N-acetyltransferase/amino-acid N-acetyltransferase
VSKAGAIEVFREGVPLAFDEGAAKKILAESEVTIEATLGDGNGEGRAWGCDLTYEYVRINGDYRT